MRGHTSSTSLGPNEHLIGEPRGRSRLNTPALILDLEAFERNLKKMALHCEANALGLRPHAKTHKTIEIARRQLAAGAVGICCAKLGEAEVLAAGGIPSILITSPVVTQEGVRRLGTLNSVLPELMVVTDTLATLPLLEAAAEKSGRVLKVLIELEVGLMRTGVEVGEQAYAIADRIASSRWLTFEGLQAFAGHLMHIHDSAQRREQSLAALSQVALARDELTRRHLAPKIITGGGTGTFDIDPQARTFTDLQAGSYLFMDRQYSDVWLNSGRRPPFESSLFVQATVISANIQGQVTTDAGLKAFATDAGPPRIVSGAPPEAQYRLDSDEQGIVSIAGAGEPPLIGTVLTCIPPHCDPTVNLYDYFHVVRGDTLVDIWRIDARGASQ